ncbi:uroporphyrinogen-III synthase [Staphylococcus borealis]|uniref:uroporphyrinogen-III synthase n=1 Tax=Staphylococcus borealis TaxID=2742203 RepID=UPI0025A21B28|nr:uroporphyrinogen-III synthase [Staphylococcus borealis]MDM7881830.1 uroporphyrinogen-III synthase [Staphylococcus borealis]MDY4021719.1 uroporphyrinogen-III synthase [Staphylococcus borealis]
MKPVVVMTQSSEFNSDLVDIVHKPFIEIQSLEFDTQVLHHNYDWIIFSSKNAVRLFYQYLNQVDVNYVAVIGKKTAELCETLNINVDFVPDDYSQEGLLEQFKQENQSILIPSSAMARPKLQQTLAQTNNVTKIDLYEPIANDRNISEVIQQVESHKIDAITFSSSSAVNAYIKHNVPKQFDNYFAIGKQTANTLHQHGLNSLVADKQTSESLINKIIESWYNNEI